MPQSYQLQFLITVVEHGYILMSTVMAMAMFLFMVTNIWTSEARHLIKILLILPAWQKHATWRRCSLSRTVDPPSCYFSFTQWNTSYNATIINSLLFLWTEFSSLQTVVALVFPSNAEGRRFRWTNTWCRVLPWTVRHFPHVERYGCWEQPNMSRWRNEQKHLINLLLRSTRQNFIKFIRTGCFDGLYSKTMALDHIKYMARRMNDYVKNVVLENFEILVERCSLCG